MFYNDINKNITGNITTSFSDHLTQYLVVTNKHWDVPLQTKRECYFYKHFHNKNLKDEINLIDWENFLQISKQNQNLPFELFNQKIESLLKTYYPKFIVSNTKLKETTKAFLKSIKVEIKIEYTNSFAKPQILIKKLKFKKDSKFTGTM